MPAKQVPSKVFPSFWLNIWVAVFSLSWLLPNHYQPWLSFHMDAWAAMCVAAAALVIVWRSRTPAPWHWLTVLIAILAIIPLVQTIGGMIPLSGVAWVSTAYLVGFCLAVSTGAQWECNQADQVTDSLFLAVGIAAILSVGLQIQQWLQIDGLEMWNMGSRSERPHANFGQPNQLATFLLWGLLGVGWALIQQRIGIAVLVIVCVFLLFGLALTASRTAWIGLATLVAASWIWRSLWRYPHLPLFVTGLGLFFVVCVNSQAWLRSVITGDVPLSVEYLSAVSGQHRLVAWTIFLDAITQQPWLGYGWYQVVPAQMAVAAEHPSLNEVFTSTHNLFLDLLIWCGVPLGTMISTALMAWVWQVIRAIRHPKDVILFLFLSVVFIHALLELPLHYGYILLPVGLVIGALNVRLSFPPIFFLPRWAIVIVWLSATFLVIGIIKDYAELEPSHENLRMEKMWIKVAHIDAPDVLLLTQWREFIEVSRIEPTVDMTPEDIQKMQNVASFFAGPYLIHKLATALALNHRADEAKLWLRRLCQSSPAKDCTDAQNLWKKQSLSHPAIAAISW